MMSFDRFGSMFPSSSGEALRGWNTAAHAILTHGGTVAVALRGARDADPDCALLESLHGLVLLVAGRSELVAGARAAAARVALTRRAGGLDPRSTAFGDALALWLDGSAVRAAERLDAWCAADANDAIAAKLSHQLRFMAGDAAGMHRSAMARLRAMAADHPARGYLLGCAAFAKEELGEFATAERLGREAVERNADDVWGIHAVAHVHEMTGRVHAGARWIEAQHPGWGGCGNMRFHLWWHLALFELERGRHDRVLALYDAAIRAERTDDFRDIANAVSLLARLELDGIGVGRRWEELAALAAARVDDDAVVFARLHYLIALLRAGRGVEAGALVASMRLAAIRGESDMDRVARHPGLALAKALQAFDAGRFADSALLFAAAAGRLALLGGSIAQRDLFERFALVATVKGARRDLAEGIIDRRRGARAGDLDAFARRHLDRATPAVATLIA